MASVEEVQPSTYRVTNCSMSFRNFVAIIEDIDGELVIKQTENEPLGDRAMQKKLYRNAYQAVRNHRGLTPEAERTGNSSNPHGVTMPSPEQVEAEALIMERERNQDTLHGRDPDN